MAQTKDGMAKLLDPKIDQNKLGVNLFLGAERFRDLIIDSYTESPKMNSSNFHQFIKTLRYRLAGWGIPVTLNEKRLLSFKGKHKGQRAFVIGNGPSLNQCDLGLLKGEITFGVNAIYLNQEKMGFYPTYYVVEDDFVAEDRADEINQLKGPTKFFGNYLRYCIQDQPGVVWLNLSMNYGPYPGFPHFGRNAARMVWVGGTVTYICLQLAYYMGFTEIYLIGFDHSYKIPADAKIEGSGILSQSNDPNHFNSSYFGKGYRWHDPMVERMEQALRRAREIYEGNRRRIFNATIGGKLEVFDRVDYSSLFN
jgi:hypothetical protein